MEGGCREDAGRMQGGCRQDGGRMEGDGEKGCMHGSG